MFEADGYAEVGCINAGVILSHRWPFVFIPWLEEPPSFCPGVGRVRDFSEKVSVSNINEIAFF